MDNLALKLDMNEKQLSIVQSEMENQKKSIPIAYVLWFFLGIFGAHRLYAGKIGSGIGMFILWAFGTVTLIIYIGALFIFAYSVWWIIDAFLLHGIINNVNQEKERIVLQKVAHM